MEAQRLPLRVAVVQFWPKLAEVEHNIERARQLCAQLEPRSVDLVCLPEMIFTGYVFPDASSIEPYLEHPKSGPTSQFCAYLSSRLECYVLAGYPERLALHEVERRVTLPREWADADSDWNSDSEEERERERDRQLVDRVGANSAVLYGPGGEWVGGYRKTNLYKTDMTWAKPGPGFATFDLPPPLGTLTLGICMDLNPVPGATWSLEGGPYELADHTLQTGSRTLVLLNAWLASGSVDGEEEEEEEDWQVVRYWAARLRPLWARKDGDREAERNDGVKVIVCNRCGEENGVTFAGSSAAYLMSRTLGKPQLLDVMGRREEGLRVWTI
ncbi:carbon-nitrogen hydrolase [Gloeophyllum trabeum ATCC 11539]|uniref:Carbon-nitrogen hydrolase n=1 Tax=Gloeophyllum trabeum (strain ATCC 11539 / FP-39264 / Madison 617) TaxID=670483 RepID=S7PTM1_GLOTA|nr:carbon-nitrogen hydrolase [Gloeophyllum trabeum ATCC 11539]EPQ51121.1 carbon-nitrogen hydrolase [Gloeophyllum trabeum ATCC 11539]